jgi:predicted nucleic acid-binding protein
MKPEPKHVLDSWAMVAWVRLEPAGPRVREFLEEAAAQRIDLSMSWINLAETFYILAKRATPAIAEQFFKRLPSLPIRMILPDEHDIMSAARIKAAHAVAFGDAFAIALAKSLDASIITGDEEIRRCRLARVSWIGTKR